MSQVFHADTGSTPTASTVGQDLTIAGDVTSTGNLVVDGRVQGDVRCVSLVLGENSQIEGNVNAEQVVMHGRLIGSVCGHRVILQATAHVEGDLFHNDLAMEQGHISKAGHIASKILLRSKQVTKARQQRPNRNRSAPKARRTGSQRASSKA